MASKVITAVELAKHVSSDDCWIAIDGSVYDISKFLNDHPGGDSVMLEQVKTLLLSNSIFFHL